MFGSADNLYGQQWRMNSGGSSYIDSGMNPFKSDNPYSDGSFGFVSGISAVHSGDVAGTTDDSLYLSVRYSSGGFSYRFDDLDPGDYQLELYFMEPEIAGIGGRWMDIIVEGVRRIDALDIYAEAGGTFIAYNVILPVSVNDGQLEVSLFPIIPSPAIISAVSLIDEATATSIASPPTELPEYRLEQNYPNPFNAVSNFGFALPAGIAKSNDVTLIIYDLLGQEIATIVSERLSPGSYIRQWDATRVSSGTYVYRLQVGEYVGIKKMVLVK